MSALRELFVYAILILLGLIALFFLIQTFKVKPRFRPIMLISSFVFCYLCFSYKSCLTDSYANSQKRQVGLYFLTNYPNCDNCILELKEDLTYTVKQNEKILETSNWHYESGGDYWITYLDNDRHQLGSGDYRYKKYKLKCEK